MKNQQSNILLSTFSNRGEDVTKGDLLSYFSKFFATLVSYPKMINRPSSPAISWQEKGDTFFDLGLWKWALKNYEKAIATAPDNHHLWINSALCLSRLDRFLAAIACYEKAIQLNPEHHEAVTYLNWAQTLRHLHRYEDALEVCRQAMNRWPNNVLIQVKSADIWCDWGRPDQSLKIYEGLTETYKESDEVWEAFGCFQQYRLKYYSGALTAYNRAVYYNSQNIRAWTHTGHCLCSMDRYRDAIAAYDHVLKIAPNRHDIRKVRAHIQKNHL